MPYTLQQLSDLEDIRNVKHRYFRSIDMADGAVLETLFTDDISVEYRGGGYRVQLEGKATMLDFLLTSFHSDAVAMHQGHMPEISFAGEDSAEGIWYLEDIFVSLERNNITIGSAIYKDQYRREDGVWKIARTEYDRIMEIVEPIRPGMEITTHYLAKVGRKPHERTDISHAITWYDEAA